MPQEKKSVVLKQPLITFYPFQEEPFWRDDLGILLLLWARQRGKSRTMAAKALRRMMQHRNLLVTYVSASLNLGREFIVKEATVWADALEKFRQACKESGQMLTTTGDDLSFDDFCDVFQSQKLETKIWHDRTSFSRSHIIAPNVATARSWSGDVILDEIGFIPDFKEVYEAIDPILSSQQKFRLLMATTPPNDDKHYSYEIAVPQEENFKPNPKGNWYVSQAGIDVHRVDAWDSHLAGWKMYDAKTREPVTPDQHRAKALDRDAWGRNYGLKWKCASTSAVSLNAIHTAMALGRDKGIAAQDDIPNGWRAKITLGPVAVGFDVATTENEKSNPSSLAVVEQVGLDYIVRLLIRWKTADPKVSEAIVREALDLGEHRRPRRLCIDATSEKFFAAELKRSLAGICPVELVVASEKKAYMGEEMILKTLTGNLLVNAMDDAHLLLPESRWVKDDFRLVRRERGGFATDADAEGNHGDTFDAVKLAIYGLTKKGEVRAEAMSVGGFRKKQESTAWKNQLYEKQKKVKLYA